MKLSFVLIFLLSILNQSKANEIDNLHTNSQVIKFLNKHIEDKWKDSQYFDLSVLDTSKFGKNKFFKLDIDQNGLTDILINGIYLFVVIDTGNNSYLTKVIGKKYNLVDIVYMKKVPLLLIKQFNTKTKLTDYSSSTDTLIFKFGGFLEFNKDHVSLKLEKIQFLAKGSGESFFPYCKIVVDSNRMAEYSFYKNKELRIIKVALDKSAYSNLIGIMEYINLDELNNYYSNGYTDVPVVNLEIYYNNGQLKKIVDHGLNGSFGLNTLYVQLLALCESQKCQD